jgi:hypothetical protein
MADSGRMFYDGTPPTAKRTKGRFWLTEDDRDSERIP